jgi:hypothetical protein
MWSFSKRLAAFCCASLTASAALLSADNDDSFMLNEEMYGNNYYDGSYGDCYANSNWNLGVEFLYWKAQVDGLPISRVVSRSEHVNEICVGGNTVEFIDSQAVHYRNRHLNYKWKPGFRLTLDYKQPDCVWDLTTAWTWLYSNAHAGQWINNGSCSSSSSSGSTRESLSLESVWSSGLNLPYDQYKHDDVVAASVRGRSSMNYNTLEFGVGHIYNACDCFVLRPHLDLKVAWIHHRLSISQHRQVDADFGSQNLMGSFSECMSAKRKFTGYGPQFGFDASWDLGSGWNLFGKASAAILYARPRITTRSSMHTELDAGNNIAIGGDDCGRHHSHHYRNHNGHLHYNTAMVVGLGWNSWLCDNSYLASFKVGYEQQIYFDQNNFHRSTSIHGSCERGNLTLHGLTLAAGLNF